MALDHQASARVHAALKADFVEGRIAPGRLNVRALASRYVTSATPVREALMRLVGEGLVIAPSSGGFVTPLATPTAIRDLYALQLVLMSAVFARLSQRLPDRLTVAIRATAAPSRAHVYGQLADATGNAALASVVRSVSEKLGVVAIGNRFEPDNDDLAVLLDASDRGDWRLAKREMEQHARRVLRYVRKHIRHNRLE